MIHRQINPPAVILTVAVLVEAGVAIAGAFIAASVQGRSPGRRRR